jgi:hypothetical protein
VVTLAEFLLARIAEDQEAAKRAAFGYGSAWASETDDAEDWSVVHADGKRDMVGCEDGDVTRHIVRWDPARVLAECDAKRRVVNLAVRQQRREGREFSELARQARHERDEMLRALAVVYADHPDYRDEWRP